MSLQVKAESQSSTTASDAASLETEKILKVLLPFTEWLSRYGETSYDFQSFYASDLARSAKALYYRKPQLGAVSYTHLDVYKRQGCRRRGFQRC